MGTSKSFAELAKKMEAAAREIETKSDVEVTAANAIRAKKVILAQMKVAAPRLTLNAGRKAKPVRIGVRYDMRKDKKAAIVKATGPAHLIERDNAPHQMPKDLGGTLTHTATGRKRSAKSQAKRRADQAKKFRIGNKTVTGPIKHPGTKGKHPFEKGVKAFLPSAGKTLEAGVDKLMKGVF